MLHVILISVALLLLIGLLIGGIGELLTQHPSPDDETHSPLITRIAMITIGGVITLLCATLPWIIASL